jgi:drug/metabolite transporter (DMT)-like permease
VVLTILYTLQEKKQTKKHFPFFWRFHIIVLTSLEGCVLMKPEVKGFLFIFISAAGFGSMPVFARIAYQDGANTFDLLTARFFVSFIALAFYLMLKKPIRPLTRREKGGAVLMGLCGYSLASLCFFTALQRISAPLASIVLFTYPAVVSCLMAIFGGEKLDKVKVIALGITFFGLALVMGSSVSSADPLGLALALCASVLYSAYVMIGNWALKTAPLTSATMWISLAAFSGIGLAGLATGQMTFQMGLTGWLAVAGMALFSTVVSILAFLRGVVLVGASRASIISTLEPPITVLLSAVFLAELLSPIQLAGGALVLASAILVNRPQKKLADIM